MLMKRVWKQSETFSRSIIHVKLCNGDLREAGKRVTASELNFGLITGRSETLFLLRTLDRMKWVEHTGEIAGNEAMSSGMENTIRIIWKVKLTQKDKGILPADCLQT